MVWAVSIIGGEIQGGDQGDQGNTIWMINLSTIDMTRTLNTTYAPSSSSSVNSGVAAPVVTTPTIIASSMPSEASQSRSHDATAGVTIVRDLVAGVVHAVHHYPLHGGQPYTWHALTSMPLAAWGSHRLVGVLEN